MVQRASKEFKDLLERMLQLDPKKRITAREMLAHPFFKHIDKLIPKGIYSYALEREFVKESKHVESKHVSKISNAEGRMNNHMGGSGGDTDRRKSPNAAVMTSNISAVVANGRPNSPGKGLPLYPNREQKAISKTAVPRGISLPNNNLVNKSMQVPLNHLSRKIYLSPQKP
jgi:serine/threonine protein kinase